MSTWKFSDETIIFRRVKTCENFFIALSNTGNLFVKDSCIFKYGRYHSGVVIKDFYNQVETYLLLFLFCKSDFYAFYVWCLIILWYLPMELKCRWQFSKTKSRVSLLKLQLITSSVFGCANLVIWYKTSSSTKYTNTVWNCTWYLNLFYRWVLPGTCGLNIEVQSTS